MKKKKKKKKKKREYKNAKKIGPRYVSVIMALSVIYI